MIKTKFAHFWSSFLFKPNSPSKIKWDIIIILLSVWNAIEIPFLFAFPNTSQENPAIDYVDAFIDFLFAVDILVNFRTGFIDPKTDVLVIIPAKISKNYIKGRFWIDLFASIPFEALTFLAKAD